MKKLIPVILAELEYNGNSFDLYTGAKYEIDGDELSVITNTELKVYIKVK